MIRMMEINLRKYVPLGRIQKYVEGAESEKILELVKEKKVRGFNVNGHFLVCLEDVKKEAREWISTGLS